MKNAVDKAASLQYL